MFKEYGPLKLPKSGVEIFFREPTGGDRLDVLKKNKISDDDLVSGSMLVDSYLAAKCITRIDGNQASGDYKFYFDKWPNADASYYQQIFNKMFAVTNETIEKMDETVNFLLNGFGSTDSTSSMNNPMEQSAGETGMI
ncbi:hypothetical protein ACFCP7_10450 [Paenibacillus elgii]